MVTTKQININLATREELEDVLGLGPDMAEAVFNHREEFGPFKNWEELKDVEGMTDAEIEELRHLGATI